MTKPKINPSVPNQANTSSQKQKTVHNCTDCQVDLEDDKRKSIECDLCGSWYCQKCTKLKTALFEEIGKYSCIMWTCKHCTIALPGLKKIYAQLASFEEKIKSIEEKLETMKAKTPTHAEKSEDNSRRSCTKPYRKSVKLKPES